MPVTYATNGPVTPQEILTLLAFGGFPRPLNDPERIQRMLENGSFYVTARDEGRLVGFVRCLTDYAYYGLVTEVAVAPSHKGKGVGREMLRITRETATPKATLILTSSGEGLPYYKHLGREWDAKAFRLRRSE